METQPTGNSRAVHSSQAGVHPRLPALVARHLKAAWRKPPQPADAPALAALDEALAAHRGPLVLDSFCGTGQSTALLARRHANALVIGIDKSAHRLHRHRGDGSYLLLQAHCEAVWQHLYSAGHRLAAHYLLYPNPWPKPGQLARRVHGHPALPTLLALGGQLELRSNWQLYVEEFGVALNIAGYPSRVARLTMSGESLTRFEEKYRNSGHALWHLTATL
jgi:tRNA G46 methylase TrmB